MPAQQHNTIDNTEEIRACRVGGEFYVLCGIVVFLLELTT